MVETGLLNVVVKRKSKKTSGFEVEKREEDGFYYITKVPPNCKTVGVGDRVLEINGTTHLDFKNEKNANSLIESIRLDVVPADSDDEESESESESDEEYEEVSKLKNKTKLASAAAAAEAAASSKKTTKRSKNNDDESADKADESEEEEDWDDSSEDRGAGKGKKAAKQNDEDEDDSMSKDSDDDDDDDDISDQEDDEEQDFVKTSAAKRNANYDDDEEEENWDRPYVSKYKPNERFMINVAIKDADGGQIGLDLVEFKSGKGKFSRNDLFVKNVDRGPFYKTGLDRGDKIISINGKKVPDKIKTAEDAMNVLTSKSKIALYAVRPDPKDKGYIWMMENH